MGFSMNHLISFISLTVALLLPAGIPAVEKTAEAALPKQQVTTYTADEQVVPTLVEVVGTLQAVNRAALAAKITGMVKEVPVVLGSRVHAGDLLVLLSAREISAQLKQAEAQFKQTERNLAREKKLLKKNATTAETVKSMRDNYAVAKASLQEARTMLGYTSITAPFSGVITAKNINVGDLATPGTILLRMENDQEMQVRCAVPESMVLQIKPGDSLEVTIPTAGLTTEGKVAEVAPSADPATRTAPVTLNLQYNKNLRTGQFARVKLPGQNKKSLYIPQTALVPKGQMTRVFVAENNQAVLRLVRTGDSHNDMIEILSGIRPGEQVITENNQHLISGQPVELKP